MWRAGVGRWAREVISYLLVVLTIIHNFVVGCALLGEGGTWRGHEPAPPARIQDACAAR